MKLEITINLPADIEQIKDKKQEEIINNVVQTTKAFLEECYEVNWVGFYRLNGKPPSKPYGNYKISD